MRRENHIREVEELAVRLRWLGVGDVQPGPAETVFFEGLD